jgi:DNA invertase Pin-like site-specific DNA recombinase
VRGIIAEYERSKILERTMRGLRAAPRPATLLGVPHRWGIAT